MLEGIALLYLPNQSLHTLRSVTLQDQWSQLGERGHVFVVAIPASCITFLSEQAFAPQNTRFWSRRRVWFPFTGGEDKPPMPSVDNRGKGVLSMDCSAKRSPL